MQKNYDLKELQKKFNEVVSFSQSIDEVNSDALFSKWAKNKAHFIEKFGGLKVELPEEICLDISEEDKRIMFKDFIDGVGDFCIYETELTNFLTLQGQEGFFSNRVINAYNNEERGIKISAGMKLSKSLKSFFLDKDVLDLVQTRMSRVIQGCKITGRMVMSVDPLDFLSVSETAHNWHSCHALDGEYRAGNLCYMADKHTFMVYLKANEEYKLPNFPFEWNSKKWRMLLYATEDEQVIVRGKEYPFSNEFAVNLVTDEFLTKYFNVKNSTGWKLVGHCIDNIMEDEVGSMQFNDCLSSPTYRPYAMYNEDLEDEVIYEGLSNRMRIGSEIECLECGARLISNSELMICEECSDYIACSICGELEDECNMYSLEGDLVCSDCLDDYGVWCCRCERTYNRLDHELIYDDGEEEWLCVNCYEEVCEENRREED